MIEIKVCRDFDYVKEVIIDDPEMFDRCSDDYMKDDLNVMDGRLWLECLKDHKRMGLGCVLFESNSVLSVHIHIPKHNRGRGTKEIGKAILNWIVKNSPNTIHKINTQIPVIYRDVIIFALSLGFKKEGVDRKSIMKDGKLLDRVCLGICFEEIVK